MKGGILQQHEDALLGELLTDSRKIVQPASSLFFALKGERRNGHLFVKDAYGKGVRNFVVSEPAAASELAEANVILVNDAEKALQALAAHHRTRFRIPVIGITGSNGKTIVKEWLNQLLADRYNIVRSPRSYNSRIGVPLSVWQLHPAATLAIIEAGISQTGEMQPLQQIIRPTIGIFTNIGDAHASGFTDIGEKVREKLKLFRGADALIYCRDYAVIDQELAKIIAAGEKIPHLVSWSRQPAGTPRRVEMSRKNGSVLTTERDSRKDDMPRPARADSGKEKAVPEMKEIGRKENEILPTGENIRQEEATLQVTAIIRQATGSTLMQGEFGTRQVQVTIPFTDDASIENAITCWCLALYLQLPQQEIATKMAGLQPVAMRLDLRNGIHNTSIINDSYSADLSSLKIALDFLTQQHQHSRRTVILTDLPESGIIENELYAGVADLLAQHNINRFMGIGPALVRNRHLFTGMETQFFPSVEALLQEFPHLHFGNETILIKGARVFALERLNRLLEQQTHQTVMEIDLGALLHNLQAYQQLLRPTTKLMAMVKAFSYGSGSYEIANALQFHKVDYLGVAYADEGVELRQAGIAMPIMVMNPDTSAFSSIVNAALEPDMYSLSLMRAFGKFLQQEGLTHYPVHIELETGMNRLGFASEDLPELLEILSGNLFQVQTVFSHLAASEDPALDAFTRRQAELFTGMSERIAASLPYPFIRHLLNSSGITRHPALQFDMVRLGIGMHGVDSTGQLDMKEVATLRSSIAQIKELRQGESVGYGRSGRLSRDSRIATVRLGYADGYPRSLGNGAGNMLVAGRMAPTIGNICMDMTMIDITGIDGVAEGQEVVVFGKGLPVQRVAAWAGTIPYEILTGVSERVKRVYFQE